MPEAWQKRIGSATPRAWAKDVYASEFTVPKNVLYVNPVGVMRRDTVLDDGSVPASTRSRRPPAARRYGIDRAVLIGGNISARGASRSGSRRRDRVRVQRLADREWLEADERFRGALVVAPQDPQLAAAEIERAGDRPGIVQVYLPLTNMLMGDRHYYPIYAAAAERGLPIGMHPNSADGIFAKAPPLAGGVYTYYIEWHTALAQVFQANVISLVCHGVFERFPSLKVVIAEGGFAWLPDVMWRLDKDWQAPARRGAVAEAAAERVHPRPRPVHDAAVYRAATTPSTCARCCEIVQAERTLLFSSDYPHWDFDSPLRALERASGGVARRIRGGTARELYGDRLT